MNARNAGADLARGITSESEAVSDSPFGSDLCLRDATIDDLPRILEIYNESIAAGWSTADTRPVTVESRREWFAGHDPRRRPLWVVEVPVEAADSEARTVVAWIGLTSFYRGRPAYDATAEVSTYVATAWHRRGLGTWLKRRMIARCPALGVTTLVSMHFDHNPATTRINEELGFVRAGWLPEIAVVQGQRRGLVLSLLRIPLASTPDESASREA